MFLSFVAKRRFTFGPCNACPQTQTTRETVIRRVGRNFVNWVASETRHRLHSSLLHRSCNSGAFSPFPSFRLSVRASLSLACLFRLAHLTLLERVRDRSFAHAKMPGAARARSLARTSGSSPRPRCRFVATSLRKTKVNNVSTSARRHSTIYRPASECCFFSILRNTCINNFHNSACHEFIT